MSKATPPWIDISVPLRPGMVQWPGDPKLRVERIRDMANGEICNVSTLSMCVHTGTHMDAPLHFIADARSMEKMPLDATIGPARVIESKDRESIKAEELRDRKIQPGERILFKTRNSRTSWNSDLFDEDFVYISQDRKSTRLNSSHVSESRMPS